MKMELGQHPYTFLLWVGQVAKELERVDRPVNPNNVDIVILNDLTFQNDTEAKNVREIFGLVLIYQNYCLQSTM